MNKITFKPKIKKGLLYYTRTAVPLELGDKVSFTYVIEKCVTHFNYIEKEDKRINYDAVSIREFTSSTFNQGIIVGFRNVPFTCKLNWGNNFNLSHTNNTDYRWIVLVATHSTRKPIEVSYEHIMKENNHATY